MSLLGRPAVADTVVVVATFGLLGVASGVVWTLVASPAMLTQTRLGPSMGELDLSRQFAATGWYVAVAGVGGVLAGIALTWWRRRNPLLVLALLVLGAALAAWAMASTGHMLGPADPETVLASARPGTSAPLPLEVTARAAYLTWPIAALVGALIMWWSSPPPQAEPPVDL